MIVFLFFLNVVGQTDIGARPVVVLWSHGQTSTKVPPVYSPASGNIYLENCSRFYYIDKIMDNILEYLGILRLETSFQSCNWN